MNKLQVKRLKGHPHRHPELKYCYDGDVGMDLIVNVEDQVVIQPGEFADIPTGIAIKLPEGTWAAIRPRSSTFFRRRLIVYDGTIDNGYTGPLYIGVFNPGPDVQIIPEKAKLAQLVIFNRVPIEEVEYVDSLPETQRGEAGMGSSDADVDGRWTRTT